MHYFKVEDLKRIASQKIDVASLMERDLLFYPSIAFCSFPALLGALVTCFKLTNNSAARAGKKRLKTEFSICRLKSLRYETNWKGEKRPTTASETKLPNRKPKNKARIIWFTTLISAIFPKK